MFFLSKIGSSARVNVINLSCVDGVFLPNLLFEVVENDYVSIFPSSYIWF